jgi:hypothetical protein
MSRQRRGARRCRRRVGAEVEVRPARRSNFNFRTDPASAFVQVDRTGMPAVATALISTAVKNPFNDAAPADDATGRFVPDMLTTLAGLTLGLADDFQRLGLTPCARAL